VKRAREAGPEPATAVDLLRGAAAPGPGPEPWVRLTFVLMAAFVLYVLYLGSRPGGEGPVRAFTWAPSIFSLTALLLFVGGLAWGATHRPLLQRRRLSAFVGLGALVLAASYPMPYPSSHEGNPSRVHFSIPVRGEWTVRWGGERGTTNPLVILPDRRWGTHLVVVEEGTTHAAEGDRLVDYFAFGRELHAPADGEVRSVRDELPDHLPGEAGSGSALGNHLVIEVAEGEFVFLCNLMRGSILVSEGQPVRVGDVLARVGNSSSSTLTPEPHLALHLQDTPVPGAGEGVPWRFSGYSSGGRPVAGGLPRGGLGAGGVHIGERIRMAGE